MSSGIAQISTKDDYNPDEDFEVQYFEQFWETLFF